MKKLSKGEKRKISVLIPLFNEEESLPILYRELREILGVLGIDYEIIFVDDGSTDKSFFVLERIYQKDNKVKVIQLRKNFGKSAALAAGLAIVEGELIITLDADLQDNPEEIPHFIEKMREGYDLICGWRVDRFDPFFKRWSSRVFNFTTSFFTNIRLHDFNCGFKAFRSEVAKEIKIYGELHRYIPVFASWRGFRVGELKVRHRPRRFGKSKFGAERFLRGFWDFLTVFFLTKYMRRPLHFFGPVGLLAFLLGLIINLYLSILWFSGTPIGGRPLLILGVLLMILGIQSISMGLLGEMITSRYHQDESNFPVRRKLDKERDNSPG